MSVIDLLKKEPVSMDSIRKSLELAEKQRAVDIVNKICEKTVAGKARSAVAYAIEYLSEWEDFDKCLPKTSLGLFSDLIFELDTLYTEARQRKAYLRERRKLKENAEGDTQLSEELMISDMLHKDNTKALTKYKNELVKWCSSYEG